MNDTEKPSLDKNGMTRILRQMSFRPNLAEIAPHFAEITPTSPNVWPILAESGLALV